MKKVWKILQTVALFEVLAYLITFVWIIFTSPDNKVPMWLAIWGATNGAMILGGIIGVMAGSILKEIWQ